MANAVLGSTAGKLLILCVLTSTAASTQTTIMPTARAVLAMRAAHGALPARLARISPRRLTPAVATIAMGAVSAIFYVLLTLASRNVLADSAAATGLLIAFYYGLTGFACVWFFRHDLRTSVRALIVKGLLPGAGGLALLGAFAASIKSYWPAASSYSSFHGVGGVFLIGAGSLLTGVILMIVTRLAMPRFFTGDTLPLADRQLAATPPSKIRRRPVPCWPVPCWLVLCWPMRAPYEHARADGTRSGWPRAGQAGRAPQTAVLAAACQVIAARGAESTRFTDVAAASGVPVSTLQYYFGSREDLLVAAFRHASANELALLAAEVSAASSPWRRIELIVARALAGYRPGSADAGLLWIESWHFAIRDPEMRVDALRDCDGWRVVAEAVRLGAGSGEFAPAAGPDQVAMLTIALVDGAGIPLALGDPGLTVASATRDVLTAVRGLVRPAPRLAGSRRADAQQRHQARSPSPARAGRRRPRARPRRTRRSVTPATTPAPARRPDSTSLGVSPATSELAHGAAAEPHQRGERQVGPGPSAAGIGG